jgi:hypothetical protein
VSVYRSLWREAFASESRLLKLDWDGSADVAVVGGSYERRWTAIRIKVAEPDYGMVVLERDICGGGASGLERRLRHRVKVADGLLDLYERVREMRRGG